MLKHFEITIIAGISGVGKSHLINKLLSGNSNFLHFSAGSLIKKRLSVIDRDELRSYSRNEILQNQYVLVDQFREELNNTNSNSHVLFDAHMLIDSEEGIIEIPFDVFQRLNPTRFIFLSADPDTIHTQRSNDTSRIRPSRSLEEIRTQQDRSRDLSLEYSKLLDIPFMELSTSECISTFETYLEH